MEPKIFADETVEDLQAGGLRLIQKKDGFRFGTDAVLLADFAKGLPPGEIMDLCTGTGIVPVLLAHKTAAPHIFGLEIQPEICAMAQRSAALNGLEGRVEILEGDVREAAARFGKRRFDAVTCNPPYMKAGAGIHNAAGAKRIARHEVLCTLGDVVRAAADILKPGGRLVMVHRPQRLAEIFWIMRQYRIEPKRLRLVHPAADREPTLCLVDGTLGGGTELRILPPLLLKGPDGRESPELEKIYGRG